MHMQTSPYACALEQSVCLCTRRCLHDSGRWAANTSLGFFAMCIFSSGGMLHINSIEKVEMLTFRVDFEASMVVAMWDVQ